jgi:hypothetical protein
MKRLLLAAAVTLVALSAPALSADRAKAIKGTMLSIFYAEVCKPKGALSPAAYKFIDYAHADDSPTQMRAIAQEVRAEYDSIGKAEFCRRGDTVVGDAWIEKTNETAKRLQF